MHLQAMKKVGQKRGSEDTLKKNWKYISTKKFIIKTKQKLRLFFEHHSQKTSKKSLSKKHHFTISE